MELLKVYIDGNTDIADRIHVELTHCNLIENLTVKHTRLFVISYDETRGSMLDEVVSIVQKFITRNPRSVRIRVARAHNVSGSAFVPKHKVLTLDIRENNVSTKAEELDDTTLVQNMVILEKIRKIEANRRNRTNHIRSEK